MASGINGDEQRQTVGWNGSDDLVSLRVDHGDCAGLSIDDVNLIPRRVCCQVGGVRADLQGPVLAEVDKIKDRDSVGTPVANVGKLPEAIGDVRKTAPSATRYGEEERTDYGG